jgi:hypothetical protein
MKRCNLIEEALQLWRASSIKLRLTVQAHPCGTTRLMAPNNISRGQP